MAVFYKLYESDGKVYARAHIVEQLSIQDLAQHMADHNSSFSQGTIQGLLIDAVSCIRELLLESKSIKLDNLCILKLGVKSTGADSVDEFSVSKNISQVRLRALATGDATSAELSDDASLTYFGTSASTTAAEEDEEGTEDVTEEEDTSGSDTGSGTDSGSDNDEL